MMHEDNEQPAWQIRPALLRDVDAMCALIADASRTTTVLPRSRPSIVEQLRDFLVIDAEGALLGCGALNLQGEDLAEIKSLVISDATRGMGLGGKLVAALVEEGKRLGLRRIFALTDSVAFFERQGFHLTQKDSLPHKVWNECIRCPKFFNCGEDAVDMWLDTENETTELRK